MEIRRHIREAYEQRLRAGVTGHWEVDLLKSDIGSRHKYAHKDLTETLDAILYTLLLAASRTVPCRLNKATPCKAKLENNSRQYNYFVFLFKKQSLHVR